MPPEPLGLDKGTITIEEKKVEEKEKYVHYFNLFCKSNLKDERLNITKAFIGSLGLQIKIYK